MDIRICAAALVLAVSLAGCDAFGRVGASSQEIRQGQRTLESIGLALSGPKVIAGANQAGTTHAVQGVCDEILMGMRLAAREGKVESNTFQLPAACVEADRRWDKMGTDFGPFIGTTE